MRDSICSLTLSAEEFDRSALICESGIMDDSGSHPLDDKDRWNRLTGKQRACLDLLIEHKTSKEIARVLQISKHTVDQRLNHARDALGAQDRNETAFLYRQMKEKYDRVTYDAVEVPLHPALVRSDFPDGGRPDLTELHDGSALRSGRTGIRPPFRGLFRRDQNAARRLWIYVAGFAATVWIILGGLGVAQALNQLLAH